MSVPLQRLSASQAYRQSVETAAFEAEHDWPLDPAQWGTVIAGGGNVTHNAALSAHVVAVSTANGDRAVLRSHARPRASANRSRSCVVVGHSASAGKDDQAKRWGLFDDNSGYFFELDGEELRAVRRSNTSGSIVETPTPRAQWSISGTATGATPVDVTKTHVWEIREVWPNGDAIFLIDGKPVHQIDTDGSIVGPAFKTARLPVSVEVANAAGTVADSFLVLAASVSVEGVAPSKTFGAEGAGSGVTTEVPLLSIRPATTFGAQANLGELLADTLTAVCSISGGGPAPTRFRLVIGGTVAGGTWAAHADAASFAELNTTATSVTGGRSFSLITDGGLSASDLGALLPALRVQADGATQDVLTLTAASIDGSAISARAAVAWKETR